MTIVLLGTLDSKGNEYSFLKDQIEAQGESTLVVNAGIVGQPLLTPDISAVQVAEAVGEDLQDLIKKNDRGHCIDVMSKGAAAVVKKLYDEGQLQGIIAMGGSAGTVIGTTAMQALPIGVPKVMVSTLASGDIRPYVDIKDITMMPSIVDISGINRFSRKILGNAAGAIVGMVNVVAVSEGKDKPLIGATMFGVTTPCVTQAREILEDAGYEVLVFHCTGIGGRIMENLIKEKFIVGVLDITTTEWADELVGGVLSAGPHRLEAAAQVGIPQVICPGALDMVNFGPIATVPDKFKNRLLYQHNPSITLMRTTVAENRELGKIIAQKLNKSKGPTTFIMPKKGFSLYDKEGQVFFDPDADTAFAESLKENLNGNVKYVEMDADLNDKKFATAAAESLLQELQSQ